MATIGVSAPQPSLPISDQLIRATARIECTDAEGKTSCGTCFFFSAELEGGSTAPLLITNRHVIERQVSAVIYLTTRRSDEAGAPRKIVPFSIHNLQSFAIYHPIASVDLAAIAFAPVIQVLQQAGTIAEFVTLRSADIVTEAMLEECRALEDLVMIGYPNGIWDSHNNRPVVRRATSATPIFEHYNHQPKFLIDCACFPGSSGSPVFLFNDGMYSTKKGSTLGGTRVALVGILHAGFLHLAKGRVVEAPISAMQNLETEITIPNSIGICIKAAELRGLIDEIQARARQQAAA